jgi:hypothetical protein
LLNMNDGHCILYKKLAHAYVLTTNVVLALYLWVVQMQTNSSRDI